MPTLKLHSPPDCCSRSSWGLDQSPSGKLVGGDRLPGKSCAAQQFQLPLKPRNPALPSAQRAKHWGILFLYFTYLSLYLNT